MANTAYTPISYNDYYVSPVNARAVLGYLGGDQTTLAAFNTAFTGNPATPALNVIAPFASPTDLHIPAATTTLLESGGASGTGHRGGHRQRDAAGTSGLGERRRHGARRRRGRVRRHPGGRERHGGDRVRGPANGGTKSVGVPFTPQASFTNLGTAAQTNVTVRYRIVGPSPSNRRGLQPDGGDRLDREHGRRRRSPSRPRR